MLLEYIILVKTALNAQTCAVGLVKLENLEIK
jgi:hypothetical protein